MTIITPAPVKHILINNRADLSREAALIAHAIVDRFDDTEVTKAIAAAKELENYPHPQTASLIRRGSLPMLDIVRPLL